MELLKNKSFQKFIFSFIIFSFIFGNQANHLVLSSIVIQPNEAEAFSIYNPTNEEINLNNYYICDDNKYYQIQTDNNLSPSSSQSGFTAHFPNINIAPDETLTIVLNENYQSFYGMDFNPDITMFSSSIYHNMVETESGSFGNPDGNRLDDNDEMLILFYWDNNTSNNVKDVDYFLWGEIYEAINKSNIANYLPDTEPEDQKYFEEIPNEYYHFIRNSFLDEFDEILTGGNGITNHDETSENFRLSWSISLLPGLIPGCTEPTAHNYNIEANFDDGSCLNSFQSIINGLYDCPESSNGYCNLNEPLCPKIKIQGMVVDYFDVTVYNGPHAITIEDSDGYRLEISVWPSEWDLANDDTLGYFINPPFNRFLMEANGSVFEYEGEKQILICKPEDFYLLQSFDQEGIESQFENNITSIEPAPYVLIPSMNETLDFSYSFPKNSRVIIRIFDISGKLITSLVDKYYNFSGEVIRNESSSAWDGRDHLGQIVPPGTYIMHIETMEPATGQTQTDAAPIVIGVQN